MMKRTPPLMFLIAFELVTARAQNPEVTFQQANQLYQQGKVADAIAQYEGIVASGLVSGEVYYNLGNCYYKQGDIPRAVLWYEKAIRLMPADDDLRHNLQLANLMLADRIEPTPKLFIWEYWDGVKSTVSVKVATWLVYAGYLMLIGSAVLFFLARSYASKKLALFAGGVSAILFALVLTVFIAKVKDTQRTDEAILQSQIVTVKNSPDEKSSDAFVLHGGVKVQIIDKVGDWLKIRLADGKVGWMVESAAAII
jgi:tetratricopeptide (TPR) repeat protein